MNFLTQGSADSWPESRQFSIDSKGWSYLAITSVLILTLFKVKGGSKTN